MNFATFFHDRRTQLGLSLADVARDMTLNGYEITKSGVGGWETGIRQPKLSQKECRRALAKTLRMDENQLMNAIGFTIQDDGRSQEALLAASLIDQMPPEKRGVAIQLLEVMVKAGV